MAPEARSPWFLFCLVRRQTACLAWSSGIRLSRGPPWPWPLPRVLGSQACSTLPRVFIVAVLKCTTDQKGLHTCVANTLPTQPSVALAWYFTTATRQATDIHGRPGGKQTQGARWVMAPEGGQATSNTIPLMHRRVLLELPGLNSNLTEPSVQRWETLSQQLRCPEPPALPAIFQLCWTEGVAKQDTAKSWL